MDNKEQQTTKKKTYQEVKHIKKKKRSSASDVSERLSEAQHHAAQGKAFALSKVQVIEHLPQSTSSKTKVSSNKKT